MERPAPREAILDLFHHRGDSFVSGAELSALLGISRSAVWKQIGVLRELGYQIEAVPSRGYRLLTTPDTLIAAEIQAGLSTRLIGREIVSLARTDSTNQRATELAEAGAVEGTVVIAEEQSLGKGRLGRRWASPPGVNLYLSVLLRPPILPWDAPQLTFLSAVAVARAIAAEPGMAPEVKWPNDLLLGGRKVAGLLNEMRAETEGIHHVVLGIGVNLNMTADQFPADLRYPATSLCLESGRPVCRSAFARRLLEHLDLLYTEYLQSGFEPVRSAWEGFFRLTGSAVEVDCQQRLVRGTVRGIDSDGALLVEDDRGGCERILAGDVRPLAL
ncbi:biotin--[acetyl-CoA-carboxylase] ligase [Desulfuromonas carbonis]|uniref:biotin--[acetyl-CoA-carboxylase] ligase n=1 Tax=Desulfuromonas sp. DDH964 TaxID=1823759 RepID=UPI00078E5516|nr:biotin--[acetyl-CoA-carboxylase] ligase [Desulfuromonas sp. DDH964]AMV71681.1 biotin operon repressor and biotin--acetyl-CoA carboxylase ligase [Desulfuromonas sp. DDH964]